jgi:hypothetical protein
MMVLTLSRDPMENLSVMLVTLAHLCSDTHQMLVTSPKGLKYSDGNLAWGRLPGSISQLAENCQEINASLALR